MSFDRLELTAEALSGARGGITVFDGLSFEVRPRRPLIVRGPNGAGKSTLLRLLAGYLKPRAGRLEWRSPHGTRRRVEPELVHYLGHLEGLKPALSVAANLRFWASYLAASAAIEEGLRRFGLDTLADIPLALLSAGQRKRASLARLLVAGRPVWLLDEPLVALDAEGRALLVTSLEEHLLRGGLAVVTTHEPLALADAGELALPGRAAA